MSENTNARLAAARAFVRSLNILLKFARMYDFGHPRTAKQYETAWQELRTAIGPESGAGLLLAASGDQLLLDGMPLESAAAEKSFARLLSSAGIASIHFGPQITQNSLARLVRGFPVSTTTKPAQLAEQLKAALDGDPNIHVNEVCFVPADSAVAKSTVAAQLAARTLGLNSEATNKLLDDPEKLLQLIVAAEGARNGGAAGAGSGAPSGAGSGALGNSGGASPGGGGQGVAFPFHAAPHGAPRAAQANADMDGGAQGSFDPNAAEGHGYEPTNGGDLSEHFTDPGPDADRKARRTASLWANASQGIRAPRSARNTPGAMTLETGLMTLQESELQGILQVLSQIGRSNASGEKLDVQAFQSRLSVLPRRARFTVSQALSALAAQAPVPGEESQKPMLLRLAEHIAVRYAVESYERGDVKVDSVRQMLDSMNHEVESLRKILGIYEEKMIRAGIPVQSHLEVLAREFWSNVPAEKRAEVLASSDVWCVPAAQVREHVEKVRSGNDAAGAEEVLRHYASCITNKDPQVRRNTAIGLAELAPAYAKSDAKLLMNVIREVGTELADEQNAELQSLMNAAFVRLSQEAAQNRVYVALQRSVELVDYIESERPGAGKVLQPRIGVEDKLPDFIEEALKSGDFSTDLQQLMRRMPGPSAEQIAKRFGRAGFRDDCESLAAMIAAIGTEGLNHLRLQLRNAEPAQAVEAVAILTRIDSPTVQEVLAARMKEWKRTAQDRAVRQIASSGTPDRGPILLHLFDSLDTLLRPLAVDEIGMCGEQPGDMRLLRLAEGDLPSGSTAYLQLKAIEALGRLRISGASAILRKIAEGRRAWRWAYPSELRIAATQALEKIDPEWVRDFVPRSGLSVAELSIEPLDRDPNSAAIRQRRYPRLKLDRPVPAMTTNLRENYRMEIPEMALGGGVALSEGTLHPGSVVEMRFNPADKSVKAQTIMRDANTQARAFEVVDIDLEERAKLRKLLVQMGNRLKSSTSQERNRRGLRTILSSGS